MTSKMEKVDRSINPDKSFKGFLNKAISMKGHYMMLRRMQSR